MRRNQAPASVVSITSKGVTQCAAYSSGDSSGENLLTDPCSLELSPHSRLPVSLHKRWLFTITHWRYFLTSPVCAGYYGQSGPHHGLCGSRGQRAGELTVRSSRFVDGARVPARECRAGPWAHSHTTHPPWASPKATHAHSGQHRPLLEIRPVSKAAELLAFPNALF